MSDVLWQPRGEPTRLGAFIEEVAAATGRSFADYEAFRRWSVDDLDGYWLAVWRHFGLPADPEPTVALAEERMPGAVWFPRIRTSYAEAALRLPGRADDDVVVVARSQARADVEWTAAGLRDQVARVRAGLLRLGVREGDRVAAYAPNVPETLALFLGAASLGAVFTSCAPEFGTQAVVDRLSQVDPAVLLAVPGYVHGSRVVDRREQVAEVRAQVLGVRVVWLPYADLEVPADDLDWEGLTAEPGPLSFAAVPVDHPLYILYSSGTTGLPKPIVHGHGLVAVTHAAALGLHTDLGPDDRFFWFTTTGWMMWDYLVSGLLVGSTIILFDGDPLWPDETAMWRMAAELGITYFGTSAPFILHARKQGVSPRSVASLDRVRGVGSTGAPLPDEGFRWVYDEVGRDLVLGSISGGTDVVAALVGSTPLVPVRAGEISCRLPGIAVESFSPEGRPVVDEVGELVVTRPIPSMPVGFWGDEDGARYRAAYFEEFPGVWRQGDWIRITSRGTCVITGRSDATLNRGGVRLGTAELYAVVESLPEVTDSLVVHLEAGSGAGRLVLLVTTTQELDTGLEQRIRAALRDRLSPRHVPDVVVEVPALARTLSGKKLEVPVKRILQGVPVEEAASLGAVDKPEALQALAGLSLEAPRPA